MRDVASLTHCDMTEVEREAAADDHDLTVAALFLYEGETHAVTQKRTGAHKRSGLYPV